MTWEELIARKEEFIGGQFISTTKRTRMHSVVVRLEIEGRKFTIIGGESATRSKAEQRPSWTHSPGTGTNVYICDMDNTHIVAGEDGEVIIGDQRRLLPAGHDDCIDFEPLREPVAT